MQEKEMFEPCTKHGQEKKYDCLECRLTVDSTPLFKKEEPQKECDHIVGVRVRHFGKYEGLELMNENLLSRYNGSYSPFKHCPECGCSLQQEREAGGEKLNLKKDD